MAAYLNAAGHWVDDGKPVRAGRCCPNCRSNRYVESVSAEQCDACGLRCDYWGGSMNAVYSDMMARHQSERADEDERRRQADEDEWRPYGDDD